MTQFIGEILKKIDLTEAQLERARRLDARMRRLDEEIDQLINDPMVKAHQVLSAEEIDALLEALPRGFHRTELRALALQEVWPTRRSCHVGRSSNVNRVAQSISWDPAAFVGFSESELALIRRGFGFTLNAENAIESEAPRSECSLCGDLDESHAVGCPRARDQAFGVNSTTAHFTLPRGHA